METKVDGDKYAVLDRIAENGFAVGLDYLLAQYEEQYGKDYKDERFVTLQQLVQCGYLEPVRVLDGVFHTISPLKVVEDDFETLALGIARSEVGGDKMLLLIPRKYWQSVVDKNGSHLFCKRSVVVIAYTPYEIARVHSTHITTDGERQGLDEAVMEYLAKGYKIVDSTRGIFNILTTDHDPDASCVCITVAPLDILSRVYHFAPPAGL